MLKTSSIHPAVSIEHRLVTDRQTDGQMDGHRAIAGTRASIASRGKKRSALIIQNQKIRVSELQNSCSLSIDI